MRSKNDGRIYSDPGDRDVKYVALRTGLGWLMLEVDRSGQTYGGLKRTFTEAVDGLEPTGFVIDFDRSEVAG